MKVLNTITLRVKGQEKNISFGIPDEDKEIDEMYKLRYRVYLKRDYIEPNKDGKELDEYDDGRSSYFIARVDNKVIGAARLIKDEYLPTEKECFSFDQPKVISSIPRDHRGEIGRLVIERYSKDSVFPRHIILLGLVHSLIKYAKDNNLEGGYAFIKHSLKVKLDKIKFPFKIIEPHKQIYDKGPLLKYFQSENDVVYPIYYLTEEIENFLNRTFSNGVFFKKIGDRSYRLKNIFLLKILRGINALQ